MKKASVGTMVFVVFMTILLISFVLGIPGTLTEQFGTIMGVVGTVGDYSRTIYNTFTGNLFPDVNDFQYWKPAENAVSSVATGSIRLQDLQAMFAQTFAGARNVYYDGYWSVWSDQQLWHFVASGVTYYIRTDRNSNIINNFGNENVTFYYYFLGTTYNGDSWYKDGDYLFSAQTSRSSGGVVFTEPFPENVIIKEA